MSERVTLQEMKIDWRPTSTVCNSDSYQVGPIFAWLCETESGWARAPTWSRCRDIVGGYLWGSLLNKSGIFHGGVGWLSGEPRPMEDELLLGVRLGTADVESGLTFEYKLGALIWEIEEEWGLPSTEMLLVDDRTDSGLTWMLRADPFWMRSPTLLSLYLLLLRASPYVKNGLGDFDEIMGQEFPAFAGLAYLRNYRSCIHTIISQGVDAWPLEQKDYYSGTTNYNTPVEFYCRGVKNYADLSVYDKKKYRQKGRFPWDKIQVIEGE